MFLDDLAVSDNIDTVWSKDCPAEYRLPANLR